MNRAIDDGTVSTDGTLESESSSWRVVLGGIVDLHVLEDGLTVSKADFTGRSVDVECVTCDDLATPSFDVFSNDSDISGED